MKDTGSGRLKFSTVYRYGLGEFGWTFLLSMVSYYLLYYLTDVLMLPVGLAGLLYAAVQWVEAGTSLAAGIVIDHVKIGKKQYTPWLLMGSVICALGLAVYFTDFHLGTVGNAVVFVLFYTISYTGFNFMWIAYRAMAGLMSGSASETVSLTISGTQMGAIGALLYSVLFERIRISAPSEERGFTAAAVVFGLILIASMAVVYCTVRKYDAAMETHKKETVKMSVWEMAQAVKPVAAYAVSYILSIGASTLILSMLVYYFTHSAGRPELMTSLMAVMTVVRFIATFPVSRLTRWFDKKYIFIVSVAAGAFFCVCAYVFRGSLPLFFLFMNLYFFALVPAGAMFMPCIADAADYNEYEKGIHARGFLYSVASTFSYIAQFVGAMASSIGLMVIGYQSELAVQSDRTVEGIAVLTLLVTAVLTALSAVPMFWYPLNRKVMGRVYEKKYAEKI